MRTLIIAIALLIAAAAQASTPLPPDVVVAADGSGQFTTVQTALDSIPKDNRDRTVVLVKDGVYDEKVRVDAPFVTLRGESRDGTRIEFPQLNDDFIANPDKLGRAVVNVNGDDFVLENITVSNTAGVVGKHAFAIYGSPSRAILADCNVLSDGADTVAFWNNDGRSYYARCKLRGAVDFMCPRGWCYMTDCLLYETKASAATWHDGSRSEDQKFVIRNCQFDGVPGWSLARHHRDGAFYYLNCKFANSMIDLAPHRVIYPLGGGEATQADIDRNHDLDKLNRWGERQYYFDCHRDGGDLVWHADNLNSAPNSPKPDEITAAWTFAGVWDPESTASPKVVMKGWKDDVAAIQFSEPVTVKAQPSLKLSDGSVAKYHGGSGTDTLSFRADGGAQQAQVSAIELNGGAIIASRASLAPRQADVTLPQE